MADTIAPPKTISLEWWKKNIPKSLPKNPKIEALLKECDGFDLGQLPKLYRAKVAELKGKTLDDIETGKHKLVPSYGLLEVELKKFKVIVTKEKHDSLVAALDVLIKHVKSARDAANKIKNAQSIAFAKSEDKIVPITTLKLQTDSAQEVVLSAAKFLAALDKSAANVTDAKSVERNIGQVRFIKQKIGETHKTMKTLSADKGGALKVPANKDLETKVRAVAKAVEGLKATVAKSEKLSLQAAMRVLGDKEGKALFMSAPTVVVALKKM